MKKAFIISVLSLIGINSATAFDIAWWEQDTVCRIDNTKCYVNMGAGFDADQWDSLSNCRGMKYICPNAFITPPKPYEAKLVSRNEIKDAISDDFDTNILSKTDDCFGVRISNKTGSLVKVGEDFVEVWCTGILDDPAEETENGGIAPENKPVTCGFLKDRGYIGVENGKCWGKPYDDSKYHVDCGVNQDFKPARLVILNGTEFSENSNTYESQQEIMKTMYKNSKEQKANYFKK